MVNEPKIVELPSGAKLKIVLAPFVDAKRLHQVLMREFTSVSIRGSLDLAQTVKDVICTGFSSPLIDDAAKACIARCSIDWSGGGEYEKITDQSFEPGERRPDYTKMVVEVVKANALPFMSNLFADFQKAMAMIADGGLSASSQKTS